MKLCCMNGKVQIGKAVYMDSAYMDNIRKVMVLI